MLSSSAIVTGRSPMVDHVTKEQEKTCSDATWHSWKQMLASAKPRLKADKFACDKPVKIGFRNQPEVVKNIWNIIEWINCLSGYN